MENWNGPRSNLPQKDASGIFDEASRRLMIADGRNCARKTVTAFPMHCLLWGVAAQCRLRLSSFKVKVFRLMGWKIGSRLRFLDPAFHIGSFDVQFDKL